jgi:hypothetical protein
MSNQMAANIAAKKPLTSFERLKQLFDHVKIKNKFLPIGGTNQVEQMLVSFTGYEHPDFKDKPIDVQLMYINDLNRLLTGPDSTPDEFYIMQFYVSLHLQANEKMLPEMITLLLRFNPQLPIGAFEINDDNVVYYRYNYVSKQRDIDGNVIVQILQMIEFVTKVFGFHFLAVSSGKLTLEQSIEKSKTDLAIAANNT